MNNTNTVKSQMKAMKVRGLSIVVNGYAIVRLNKSEWRIGEVCGDWLVSGPLELVAQRATV